MSKKRRRIYVSEDMYEFLTHVRIRLGFKTREEALDKAVFEQLHLVGSPLYNDLQKYLAQRKEILQREREFQQNKLKESQNNTDKGAM